jgi:hypothetical protein
VYVHHIFIHIWTFGWLQMSSSHLAVVNKWYGKHGYAGLPIMNWFLLLCIPRPTNCWLDHRKMVFLIFWWTSILISIVAGLIYIPNSNEQGFLLPSVSSPSFVVVFLFL